MAEIYQLDVDECLRLLRAGAFGRLAFVGPDGPEIIPINYAVHDRAVVVRTARGGLVDTHAPGSPLAFEVDHVNYERGYGWSVVARGFGERADDDATAALRSLPRPPEWASRGAESWIRLPWTSLTGRRIGRGWDPLREMPVRRAWSDDAGTN